MKYELAYVVMKNDHYLMSGDVAINNGLKYHEIFKRGREMLMQIREG